MASTTQAGALDEAKFEEGKHPRAENGQFGSGGAVHIVTTSDGETTTFHHVGADSAAASEAHAAVDEDEHGEAEYHAPKLKGDKKGERTDAVHIVHAQDGAGGTDVHGVHATYGAARKQASDASEAEWDEHGPDRGDLDRDQGEEDEAALAWNAEHAGDHDDVMVKVDADGDVERDDDGNLQWVQDGVDVDPTDDHLAAFDDVFEDMYPSDDRAAYPGLDAANEHFEGEGRHESVFRIYTHKAQGQDAVMTSDAARVRRDVMALDRASVRRVDADGHLHVDRTPISKANVCGYLGSEIPGWRERGLTADRIYRMWRHPDELQKAVPSAAGKPLFMGHRAVGAIDHDHENNVGSVTAPRWEAPYVTAALDVWPQTAIDAIVTKEHAELSSAYRYEPDMTPGTTPDGERYDGVMRDIDFSHVALVPEGRAGKDVRVMDAALLRLKPKDPLMSRNTAVPSRTAASARGAFTGGLATGLAFALRSKLAADAKPDYGALVKGITPRNIRTRTPALVRALDAATKGKLAKDAELSPEEIGDIVQQVGEMVAEKSDDIAAAIEPDVDATADSDDADLRALLKAKGYSDEEIDAICAKEAVAASAAATDAEKAKEDAVKGMDAKIAAAKREATTEARKGMVEQAAMDSAISAAVDGAVAAERQRNKDIREAEAHIGASSVGKLKGFGAYDSAPEAWRAGLEALGVKDADKLHDSALRSVFDAHAGLKAAQTAPRRQAQDAAPTGVTYDTTAFPNANRLKK